MPSLLQTSNNFTVSLSLHVHPRSAILIINKLTFGTVNPGRTLVQMWFNPTAGCHMNSEVQIEPSFGGLTRVHVKGVLVYVAQGQCSHPV